MSEVHIVDVGVKAVPSRTSNASYMQYAASSEWVGEELKAGVLIVFNTAQDRDEWWRGRP